MSNPVVSVSVYAPVIHYKPEDGIKYLIHYNDCAECQDVTDDPYSAVQATRQSP